MQNIHIDLEYLKDILRKLVDIPSPAGYTDAVVHFVGGELQRLGIPFELTRRGAIRARLDGGADEMPARALVAHLDTLGAMVRSLKPNGRLSLASIGTWSSRFAEGARVTIFTREGVRRGTILPLKASGHVYDDEVDSQPTGWDHVELRVDEFADRPEDLLNLGIKVGDYVALDPNFEISDNGFINSRYLDNNGGVAVVLAVAKAVREAGLAPEIPCYLLFTIFEEVGSGASSVLHGHITEMVSIDNSTVAPGQASTETGITIAMMDSSGPFDYHLTHKLIDICDEARLRYTRDIFRYYRCDAASAVEAGSDIRTALACYGVDASHGYERTHQDSLFELCKLMSLYIQSPPTVGRDRYDLGPIKGFPHQPIE